MATATTVQSVVFGGGLSLSTFVAWCQPISTALSTFGWTKTSDTGQVNWGTISSLPGASVYVYEIWTPGDTLQSTAPVYMKISYGLNSTSYPSIIFQIGSGTNGSGTLLNSVTVSTTYASLSIAAGTTCYFSGNSGRFSMWLGNYGSYPNFISIERINDMNGYDTSNGLSILSLNYSTVSQCTITGFGTSSLLSLVYADYSAVNRWLSFGATTSTTVASNTFAMYPILPIDIGYNIYPPLVNTLIGRTGDIGSGLFVPVSVYGTVHTFITFTSNANLDGNTSSEYVAMRFE